MNGFKLMADSYRKASTEGKIDKEQADKDIRIFDFLATCDDDDFYRLFDSSAFNEIAKSYMRLAVRDLENDGTLTKQQGEAVRERFCGLFDEVRAKEVCERSI